MKSKFLLGLVVSAAAAAGASWVVVSSSHRAPKADAGAALIPGLESKINDVASIEIRKGKDVTLLTRSGGGSAAGESGWALTSRGGYPAEFERIKTTVVGLSKAEIAEAKTSKPDLYPRIGVEEPREGAPSALVTLKDSAGAAVGAVIIGNSAAAAGAPGGGGDSGTFVRRAGEAQSFLARGVPAVDSAPMSWIKKDFLRIEQARVQSVTITHPAPAPQQPAPADGSLLTPPNEQLIIEKSGTDYVLKNMPPGREIKAAGTLTPIAGALSYVEMEDVMPAAELTGAAAGPVAEFRTTDGLVLTVTLRTKEGKTWATFAASAVPVAVPAAPPAGPPIPPPTVPPAEKPGGGVEEQPSEQPGAVPATPAAPTSPGAQPEGAPKANTPADLAQPAQLPAAPQPMALKDSVVKEAADLNKQLGPWAFALPSYRAQQLGSHMSDVLKEVTPPAVPAAPAGPVGPGGG